MDYIATDRLYNRHISTAKMFFADVGRARKPARTIHVRMDAKMLYQKGTDSNTISAYSICIELPDPRVLIALNFLKACLAGLLRQRFEL